MKEGVNGASRGLLEEGEGLQRADIRQSAFFSRLASGGRVQMRSKIREYDALVLYEIARRKLESLLIFFRDRRWASEESQLGRSDRMRVFRLSEAARVVSDLGSRRWRGRRKDDAEKCFSALCRVHVTKAVFEVHRSASNDKDYLYHFSKESIAFEDASRIAAIVEEIDRRRSQEDSQWFADARMLEALVQEDEEKQRDTRNRLIRVAAATRMLREAEGKKGACDHVVHSRIIWKQERERLSGGAVKESKIREEAREGVGAAGNERSKTIFDRGSAYWRWAAAKDIGREIALQRAEEAEAGKREEAPEKWGRARDIQKEALKKEKEKASKKANEEKGRGL